MRFHLTKTASALCVLSLLVGFSAGAQEDIASDMDILREKLAADKKLVVAGNLELTESQAAAFWPIYDEYQNELSAINQRLGRLIVDYAQAYNSQSVTDATAKELLGEAIAIDEAEVALRKTYAGRLDGVIPAIEAARYLQIENKIRAVIRYDLASEIPLVN